MNNKEELKRLLSLRINQYEMLNNTLNKMINNDSSNGLIDGVRKEINATLDEIKAINIELSANDEEEDVTYSFYHTVLDKEDDNKAKEVGFYDSIVRSSKAAEFKEAEYAKADNVKINYKSNNIKPKPIKEVKTLTNKYINKINDTIDSRISSNRFLVSFRGLDIPEIMVKSVSFDPNDNMLTLSIYDFLNEVNGKKFPIMAVLKKTNGIFDMEIKHIKSNGDEIYVETYIGCCIDGIYRDPIDYSCSDFSLIQILVKYSDVTYEAAN